ncbi:MAG: LysR family transcriptional regulator [Clostridia bacterium]|nr:LysR family transcriptional regulator [Clostridia bacterium]
MNVNFELYKVFYYAAKHLNYSNAAKALYVSQSSVSQNIRTLEEQLGSKLFYRAGKGVHLTEEGKMLYKYIEKAFNIIKSGEKNIESLNSLETGTVRIGASDTICKYFLFDALKEFHALYPKVNITINNRPSSISLNMVNKGLMDVGIININPFVKVTGYNVIKFTTFNSVFIASEERFGHLKGRILSLKELADLPLISLEKDSTTRRILDRFLEERNLGIQPEFEFGSMDLILEMTKLNVGIGFVAEPAANSILKDGIFKIQLKETLPSIDIGIVYNSSVPQTIATKTFIDLLATYGNNA